MLNTNRRSLRVLRPLLLLGAAALSACGSSGGSSAPNVTSPAPLATGSAACSGDLAADFACFGIDLLQRMPAADLGGGSANDVWGWYDTVTDREYALLGMTNGTAFVDITDPENPIFLGRLPTQTVSSVWRDIKVYENHAYIVADRAGAHGMQVFDLTRLRGLTAPQTFIPDNVYVDFENAHNIAINEATAYAYAVGTNTCNGGLHIIDIITPINPLFAGCHSEVDTHDTQCVVYQGPDSDYTDREICFSSNGEDFSIDDVTDKGAPVTIAATTYPDLAFVHQGWATEDQRYFLLGDEFDEINFGVPTRTHVFDISDLDAPVYLFAYEGPTAATDHNLYVLGDLVFEANYTSGLSVLQIGDLANEELAEIAFFDTFPGSNSAGTSGAWSVYPFLPSGTIIVSDVRSGLFLLALQ